MIIIDKETKQRIKTLNITTTEKEIWTTWTIWNSTLYKVKPELILPDAITLITKLPDEILSNHMIDIDVRINTEKSIKGEIKLTPHMTEIGVN